MKQIIHRKNSYKKLKEMFDNVLDEQTYFSRSDFELALKVIETQDEMILGMSTKIKRLKALSNRLTELRVAESRSKLETLDLLKKSQESRKALSNIIVNNLEKAINAAISAIAETKNNNAEQH